MRLSTLFKRTLVIMLAIFGLIATSTSVLTSWTLRQHMTDEYVSKGKAIAQSIATTSAEVLLTRDASTVQAMIDEYLNIPGAAYVLVHTEDGEVVAHTFVPMVPESFRQHLPSHSEERVVELSIPGMGEFVDVNAAVLGGVAGTVHVGMDRDLIDSYVAQAVLRLQGLLAVLFALCSVAMYVLVNRISRPLSSLTAYAERLADHDFTADPGVGSLDARDEVGILARTMRSMAEELRGLVGGLEAKVQQATAELCDTLASMSAIIDNLADGLLVVDSKLRITHSNPALLSMFRLEGISLDGRDIRLAFPASLARLALDASVRLDACEAEVDLPGGRVGKAVASAIRGGDAATGGARLGSVILVRDVTWEKQVDRMKTEFISTVSHELRTPLTSIIGFAKIIAKKLAGTLYPAMDDGAPKVARAKAQVSENLEIIMAEGLRLTELVNDVLDISKMESGRVEWRMSALDIAVLVEHSLAATATLFAGRDIELVREIPEGLPPAFADRDRIVQVLVNLLSNAAKFTPSGSVTVSARAAGDMLEVCVRDTGAGIPEEDLEQVFERFKQSGDTLRDKPKGTGLGLPICRHIVESHGGRIRLESSLGQGSAFTFSLPLAS